VKYGVIEEFFFSELSNYHIVILFFVAQKKRNQFALKMLSLAWLSCHSHHVKVPVKLALLNEIIPQDKIKRSQIGRSSWLFNALSICREMFHLNVDVLNVQNEVVLRLVNGFN
jgi:hypothetical protein